MAENGMFHESFEKATGFLKRRAINLKNIGTKLKTNYESGKYNTAAPRTEAELKALNTTLRDFADKAAANGGLWRSMHRGAVFPTKIGAMARGARVLTGAAAGPAGLLGMAGLMWLGKKAVSLPNSLMNMSMMGSPGVVGYGKRGIDANNLNTDGLVQGLSKGRRK